MVFEEGAQKSGPGPDETSRKERDSQTDDQMHKRKMASLERGWLADAVGDKRCIRYSHPGGGEERWEVGPRDGWECRTRSWASGTSRRSGTGGDVTVRTSDRGQVPRATSETRIRDERRREARRRSVRSLVSSGSPSFGIRCGRGARIRTMSERQVQVDGRRLALFVRNGL